MNFLAELRRAPEATDPDSSSNLWGRPINTRDQTPNPSPYLTQNTQPISAAASGGGGDRHRSAPKPGGASFEDSPLIANVEPHETYKIHVATKSDKIHRTPGIVRRVVEDVARLYYATGERPGLSLKGIRGKGGWQEFTVAIGPLKHSPLALAMYRVDVFMKAFTSGARYFPRSGSSLDETRRLAEMSELLEAERQRKGIDIYDWAKKWGGCYDFQDDIKLKNLYQKYKRLCSSVKGTGSDSYCFSPYVRSCSVSKDGKTFFFEPDIHVSNHGYNMQNGTPVDFDFDETEKKYVQIVKDAIDSNSELAYDLDIIHVACCAYALVQSLPPSKAYDLRDDAPVPEPKEKMERLSRLQYGIVYHCSKCSTGHLSGGCSPDWGAIRPTVVGTDFSIHAIAFDLPTMDAACLERCLRADWSRTLVENFDETLVLDVAMHDRPYRPAKEYSRAQKSAALRRNPHESRLVGPSERFESYLELVEYYKSGTEKLRASYKKEPGAFTSRWKVDVFDAGAAILQLAKNAAVLELANNKGDSEIVEIVHRRLHDSLLIRNDRYYVCLRQHRYFPYYSAKLQDEITRRSLVTDDNALRKQEKPGYDCAAYQEFERRLERERAHEANVQKRDNLEQQLAELEPGRNLMKIAPVLFNLGNTHVALGEEATARGFYQRALDMFEREYGTDFLHTRLCRRQLGRCPAADEQSASAPARPTERGSDDPNAALYARLQKQHEEHNAEAERSRREAERSRREAERSRREAERARLARGAAATESEFDYNAGRVQEKPYPSCYVWDAQLKTFVPPRRPRKCCR